MASQPINYLAGEPPIKLKPKLSLPRILYVLVVLPLVAVYLGIATIIRELFIGGDSLLDLIGRFRLRSNSGLVQRSASKTAVFVAIVRYVGSHEGWTNDTLSRHFIPSELVRAIDITKMFQPKYPISLKRSGALMARTLAGDRLILNGKPKQVVLLGAGLDTRAHRLKLPAGCKVFEIDIATTQAMKKKVAAEHPDEFKNQDVQYVAVDFSKELFTDKLAEVSDFDFGCSETVVLFEGVSMYLPWPALEQTMKLISTKFAPGTIVGMDVIDDFFTEEGSKRRKSALARRLMRLVTAVGEPFQWGLPIGKTAEDVFPPLGFNLVQTVDPADVERDFLKIDGEDTPFARVPSIFHYIVLRVK